MAVYLESPDAPEQVLKIGDGPVSDRTHEGFGLLLESIRQQQAQLQCRTVGEMHGNVALSVRPVAHRDREPPADFLERVEDVLAGA